jgi:hypothetical protein
MTVDIATPFDGFTVTLADDFVAVDDSEGVEKITVMLSQRTKSTQISPARPAFRTKLKNRAALIEKARYNGFRERRECNGRLQRDVLNPVP